MRGHQQRGQARPGRETASGERSSPAEARPEALAAELWQEWQERAREPGTDQPSFSGWLSHPGDRTGAEMRGALMMLARQRGVETLPLLEAALRSEELSLILAAVEALGTLPGPEAGARLQELEQSSRREVNKAVRRALHRRRAAGLPIPIAPSAAPTAPAPASDRAFRAAVTAIDSAGNRAVYFFLGHGFEAVETMAVVIGDRDTILGTSSRDGTRRGYWDAFQRDMKSAGAPWVEVPVSYARYLLEEARATTLASGAVLPRKVVVLESELGRPVALPERPPVYEEISVGQLRLQPDLLERSPELLYTPEMSTWRLPAEDLAVGLRAWQEASTRRVALPEWAQVQRQRSALQTIVDQAYPPEAIRRLRRRLEEAAYYFLRSDRPLYARMALAVAVDLGERRPEQLAAQPFIRAQIEESVREAWQENAGLVLDELGDSFEQPSGGLWLPGS